MIPPSFRKFIFTFSKTSKMMKQIISGLRIGSFYVILALRLF